MTCKALSSMSRCHEKAPWRRNTQGGCGAEPVTGGACNTSTALLDTPGAHQRRPPPVDIWPMWLSSPSPEKSTTSGFPSTRAVLKSSRSAIYPNASLSGDTAPHRRGSQTAINICICRNMIARTAAASTCNPAQQCGKGLHTCWHCHDNLATRCCSECAGRQHVGKSCASPHLCAILREPLTNPSKLSGATTRTLSSCMQTVRAQARTAAGSVSNEPSCERQR